jgi:hypothetical protein
MVPSAETSVKSMIAGPTVHIRAGQEADGLLAPLATISESGDFR